MNEHFDFGKNWQEFSEQALSEKNIKQAAKEFGCLLKILKEMVLEDYFWLSDNEKNKYHAWIARSAINYQNI